MARPSKKQLLHRNLLINTGDFSRTSKIYTDIEERLSNLNDYDKSYSFCLECNHRYTTNILRSYDTKESYNHEYHPYMSFLAYGAGTSGLKTTVLSVNEFIEYTIMPYTIVLDALKNEIQNNELKINLDECFNYYILGKKSHFIDLSVIQKKLTSAQFEKLIEYTIRNTKIHNPIMTIIKPIKYNLANPHHTSSKKAYVEVDLNKSLDDIYETIKHFKEKFDETPNIVPSLEELLGKSFTPFTCLIKDCDIFAHKHPKTLEGKMADLLFIYDCKKVGLTKNYIEEEITKYWRDIKKISTEGFFSFDDYYTQAKKYIDEQKYKSYLIGSNNYPST